VADLAGLDRPGTAELDVALRLRSASPLLLHSLPVHGAPTGELA
jgi:magnesium chelatase family protein